MLLRFIKGTFAELGTFYNIHSAFLEIFLVFFFFLISSFLPFAFVYGFSLTLKQETLYTPPIKVPSEIG
jgi:phage shock protein PspC (stress-responsive transcriptional regulator)